MQQIKNLVHVHVHVQIPIRPNVVASLCFGRPIYIGLNTYQLSKPNLSSYTMYTHNLSVTICVGSLSSNFKIIATQPDSGYRFVGCRDGFVSQCIQVLYSNANYLNMYLTLSCLTKIVTCTRLVFKAILLDLDLQRGNYLTCFSSTFSK